MTLKKNIPFISNYGVRAIINGKYKGTVSTASEKELARKELKRRGVSMSPKSKRKKQSKNYHRFGF